MTSGTSKGVEAEPVIGANANATRSDYPASAPDSACRRCPAASRSDLQNLRAAADPGSIDSVLRRGISSMASRGPPRPRPPDRNGSGIRARAHRSSRLALIGASSIGASVNRIESSAALQARVPRARSANCVARTAPERVRIESPCAVAVRLVMTSSMMRHEARRTAAIDQCRSRRPRTSVVGEQAEREPDDQRDGEEDTTWSSCRASSGSPSRRRYAPNS